MKRVALLSVHSCPSGRVGEGKVGGMTIYLGALTRHLAAHGIAADLITQPHPGAEHELEQVAPGIRVLHVDPVVLDHALDIDTQAAAFADNLAVRAGVESIRYDLVHSNYWASGVVGALLARHWNVPHAVTFHTLAELKSRAFADNQEPPNRAASERAIARGADAVVAFTPDDRDFVAKELGVPTGNVTVVPCGVDTQLFSPRDGDSAKRTLGYTGHQVVLFVGRLEPLKGAYIALEAFARLSKRQGRKLVMVGGQVDQGEMDKLHVVARRLGIAGDVDFVGPVDHHKLPDYYAAADVYLCPSYYESFGLSILEAMACARPTVVIGVGGPRHQVRHGETGFVIDRPDPELCAARLDQLLGDAALLAKMGRAGRAVAETYTWPRMGASMLALYERLLAEAPRGSASR